MAQATDFTIANQSFPSFRTDLNTVLSAINTMNSGTSRPSSVVAGTNVAWIQLQHQLQQLNFLMEQMI